MILLGLDNRVFNYMRQTMNEQIEDERGLMIKTDFKKMLFTACSRMTNSVLKQIYEMIMPVIEADGEPEAVSIAKISSFIDFFNYAPIIFSKFKHKNATSEDLQVYMGKQQIEQINPQDMEEMEEKER